MGQHAGDLLQQGPKEEADKLVSGPGTIGDAGIDHGYWDSAAEAAIEKVGPEFSLCKNEQAGFERVKVRAGGPWQIERAIEDAVGTEAFKSKSLAGAGGGGDDYLVARKSAVQLANQAAGSQHFSH